MSLGPLRQQLLDQFREVLSASLILKQPHRRPLCLFAQEQGGRFEFRVAALAGRASPALRGRWGNDGGGRWRRGGRSLGWLLGGSRNFPQPRERAAEFTRLYHRPVAPFLRRRRRPRRAARAGRRPPAPFVLRRRLSRRL